TAGAASEDRSSALFGFVPRAYLLPVAAAFLTVVVATLAIWVVVRILDKSGSEDSSRSEAKLPQSKEVEAILKKARTALAQRNPHVALEELAKIRIAAGQATTVSAAKVQELQQLERQAALLADLLEESLQDLVHHAARTDPKEWAAVFARRYQGKAVVLDAPVVADLGRPWRVDISLWMDREEIRVDVGDLRLLQRLPLEPSQRVIFGGRVAGIRKDSAGTWLVKLIPESGVLLTDFDVLVPYLHGLDESERAKLRAVIDRQQKWLQGDDELHAP